MNVNLKVANSIKLIFIAFVLTVIGTVLYAVTGFNLSENTLNIFGIIIGSVLLVSALFELIAFIKVRNINTTFHTVFVCTIVALALNIANLILILLPTIPVVLVNIFNIIVVFCQVFAFFLFIWAIAGVNAVNGKKEFLAKANWIQDTYLILILVFVIIRILFVSSVLGSNPVLAIIFAVIGITIIAFAYAIYYAYLIESYKALKQE